MIMLTFSVFLSCSNEEAAVKEEASSNNQETTDSSTIKEENPEIAEEIQPLDSIQEEAYKNDLSLEIKPIKEEEKNPISQECAILLEEYADAIKQYDALLSKIDEEPDDISLMIKRTPMEENLQSYATKPQFFSCSQNKAFTKQFDILNAKKDKLLFN